MNMLKTILNVLFGLCLWVVSTGCISGDDSTKEELWSGSSTEHFIKRFWYQQQGHQCGNAVSDGWEIGADDRVQYCFPAIAPTESYPHKYLQVSYWLRTSAPNPNDDSIIAWLTVYSPGAAVAQRPLRLSDFEGTGWQEIRQNVDMSGREGATITPTVYFTVGPNRNERLVIGMMDIYWRQKQEGAPIGGGLIPQ